jgi:hypothetical protein
MSKITFKKHSTSKQTHAKSLWPLFYVALSVHPPNIERQAANLKSITETGKLTLQMHPWLETGGDNR